MQTEIKDDLLNFATEIKFDSTSDNTSTADESMNSITVIETPKKQPSLNVVALVCMGFFWVSGGMYGNEELMSNGTPVYALPCLLIVPILYSAPVSLINSELARAMPWEGGAVAWIGEALGETLGTHTAYWIWFASVLDSSLYPRFAAAYLAKQLDLTHTQMCCSAMGMIALINIIKLCGLKSVVSFSIFLCVIAIAPSFILLFLGFSKIDWSILGDNSGEPTKFSTLLTWILWLYQGVLSMGSVSKDVKNAGRTYLLSSLILFTLDVMVVNFTPLLISLSIDPDRTNYHAGHFIKIGNQLCGGHWLGILLTIASQISLIGLYQSWSIASDNYISRFYNVYISPSIQSNPKLATLQTDIKSSRIKHWMFTSENSNGVPRAMILFNASIVMCLAWVKIEDTMVVSVLLITLGIGLLTVSYLILRFTRPDINAKFEMLGGHFGACVVAFPCIALVALNVGLSLSDTSSTVNGIPVRSVAFVAVVSVGVACQATSRFINRRVNKQEERMLRASIMPDDSVSYGTDQA